MRATNLDPKFIGTWFPPGVNWSPEKIKSLASLVRRNGWRGIPRAPVYELPDGVKAKHKYLLADGHKRRLVADKLVLQLPCAKYKPREIINPERDNLGPFEFLGNPNGSEHYNEVLLLYQDPTIVGAWIREQRKSKWNEDYLERLFLAF